MDKLASLRKKYPTFFYESFDYKQEENSLVISFSFKTPPDIEFNPSIRIENINNEVFAKLDEGVLDNFIFNLGLVEMISYWKATCSAQIEIKTGFLDQKQVNWWKDLLLKGLGEFFYQNNIDSKAKDFVNIRSTSENHYLKDESDHKRRYLILNSGGRDSVVTLEVLKELQKEVGIFMLNPTKASLDVAKTSRIKDQIVVRRDIDTKLLKLNDEGYLNGHTPFSAYLAFLAALSALIFDYRHAISSNERSSNEENIEFLEEKINHQYSKSFEFEKLFRVYFKENLSDNIEYLSLLRPLYEIQISKLFTNFRKYFKTFRSCNKGQKTNSWCGECAKCLSIYISLYSFVDKNELTQIFGTDLYEKKQLLDLLLQITGEKKPKPFECVGTYQEILEGLRLSVAKLEQKNERLSYLLEYAKENILSKNPVQADILNAWNENNFLPEDVSKLLRMKIS